MKVRTIVIGILLALFVPLVTGAVVILDAFVDAPQPQGPRVEGPHGVVGIWAEGAYAWVVPVDEQRVVVIDAGTDPAATALRTELAGREVVATLLTHGHVDARSGVDALPDAPLYYGPGEGPLVRGERAPGGYLAAWLSRVEKPPRLPEQVHELSDGEVLSFGSLRIRVVHMPGHTDGSVAYLWRDVLFSGDAVLGGEALHLPHEAFATDADLARVSLGGLRPLAFEWLCDGHVGVREGAREALFSLLDEPVVEPTVHIHDDDVPPPLPPGSEDDALRIVEGRYVQDPPAGGIPGAAYLVDDRGQRWVLAEAPIADHTALRQRRVRATGRARTPQLGSVRVAGVRLELQGIEALDDRAAGVLRVGLDALGDSDQAWVELVAPLHRLEPLADGAARADGHLGHGEGAVALNAPTEARRLSGQLVTVLARVDGDQLVAAAVCEGDAPGCGRRPPTVEP